MEGRGKVTNDKGKQMTSVRVSREAQTIIKLIKREYRGIEGVSTQDDAFLKFMEENHPNLFKEALRIAQVKRELDELFEGDD